RLDSLGAELDRERRDLARWEEELVAAERRLEAEAERFNRALADHRRTADSLVRAFPVRRIQSGRYQESLKLRDGQVVGLEREIRIHQFDNPEDLVFIIAHELGHALGLGHAEEPGALMRVETGPWPPSRGCAWPGAKRGAAAGSGRPTSPCSANSVPGSSRTGIEDPGLRALPWGAGRAPDGCQAPARTQPGYEAACPTTR